MILKYALNHCLAERPSLSPTFMSELTFKHQPLKCLYICWNPFFLPPAQRFLILPLPHNAQSLTDPPPCLTLHKVFFSINVSPSRMRPKRSISVSLVQSELFQKASEGFLLHTSDASFCVEVSFFLATLPCRSLLFKFKYVVLLPCERLDHRSASLLCSSFSVMCGFF